MEKHNTATVLIVTQEEPRRMLMVFHNKFQCWMPPGGHVESHENPHEAAIREVREETGLDISSFMGESVPVDDHATSWPIPYRMYEEAIPEHGEKPAHFHIDHVYLAFVPHQEVVHDPNESEGIRWVGEDEIETLEMYENCRTLMKDIIRGEKKM